jgi:thiamine-monophosphate kinase
VKLARLGEAKIIAEITRGVAEHPDVPVGIGDDCAAVRGVARGMLELLKVDGVVEGIHFDPQTDLRRVGWKAVCRPISDIAAMGGLPKYALLTVAVPAEMDLSQLKALSTGIRRACARHGVTLVGGETSRSPGPLFISVTLTGFVERARCVTRSGGSPGDLLYVTGRLGGSLKGWHLDFAPRVKEARWLTEHFTVKAMTDLSDGLAADLPRLAAASECGFTLQREAIPRNRDCSVEDALSNGEDYELLFAIDSRTAKKMERAWRKRFPRLPLVCIGLLEAKGHGLQHISGRGYDHFA